MTQRKKMSPRKLAKENGVITYEGKPCKREGHTLRYRGGQCVKCNKSPYYKTKDSKYKYNNTEKGKKQNTRARLRRNYGITEFDWLRMYEEQGGKCSIPSCTFTFHDRWWEQGVMGFSVDHCHKTGKIRGLLCCECNKETGKIENNIKLVHERIKYVYNFMSQDEKTMKQKKIVKEVKENGNGEFYLEFSNKELSMFGLEKGDSVEWMQLNDGEVWKKVSKKKWSI